MNSNNDIQLKPIALGDDHFCQLSILNQLDADDMTLTIYEKNENDSLGRSIFVADIFPDQVLDLIKELRLQIDVYSGVIARGEPIQQYDRHTGRFESFPDEEE